MIIHYLSASRLKKYLQCSEAYYQTYENKVRSDAVHLRFGTMIHKVFERWFQEDKPILEIYEEEWVQHDVVELQYYKDGIDIVKWFEEDTDIDSITAIGFEMPFAIDIENHVVVDTDGIDFSDISQLKAFLKKLEEDDKPYIFGYIDRVDYVMDRDTIRITDYKTSRIALTKNEADADEQLSMYALVASYLYPEYENVELTLHYVRLRDKVTTYRAPDELEEFRKWLVSMYYIIKNDISPVATINKYCGWCDARHGCVPYQDLLNSEPEDLDVKSLELENMDAQLEKIDIHMKVLKDRKSEIEKRFKEELKKTDNEPIDVGNREIYVTNNARVSYDVSTVISLFPDIFDDLLTVKKSDVDKLAKGNPEVLEALEQTAERYYISPTLRKKKK